MVSYDVETTSFRFDAIEHQKKGSFLRKWGLALFAISGVIAINVALLGPTGSNIPAVSEQRNTANKMGKERYVSVLEMESNIKTEQKNQHVFGSRNLTEEEGGVMEYTRRRHRILADYTHKDVADQFNSFGKWSVSLIYFAFWVFLMFPNWFLPIGRPGIALGGGLSMVVWRFILERSGWGPVFYAEKVIIMEPLFLLFGLMMTTIYLEKMERGGIFDKLRNSLDDLSLATTANIGSALTMTGNPQNILIVSLAYDDIGWLEFASNMILPVIGATFLNCIMMFTYYGAELFPGSSGFIENVGIMLAGRKTPEIIALENAYHAKKAANPDIVCNEWSLWSKLQVVIVVAFLVCFGLGFDVCVVSICAGIILMILAAYKHQHYDPKPDNTEYDSEGNPLPPKKMYDMDGNEIEPEEEELITESETTLTEVDYGLLLLFIGQFLLIGSFDDTGVPQNFFEITMGTCVGQMTDMPCVFWFVFIITILSNVASNVPVCQMLAATFPYATPYDWMQVSFSATIAGNLTMLGSAANMIVAFQAAKVGDRTFTSERHAPFGIPSTIGCLYVGTILLHYIHFSPECSERMGTCNGGNVDE